MKRLEAIARDAHLQYKPVNELQNLAKYIYKRYKQLKNEMKVLNQSTTLFKFEKIFRASLSLIRFTLL